MDILNFALTLEHLEVAYYTQGLNKFNATDFKNAGLPDFARGRFEEILMNEETHVDTLSAALGANATNPCLYDLYVLHATFCFWLTHFIIIIKPFHRRKSIR